MTSDPQAPIAASAADERIAPIAYEETPATEQPTWVNHERPAAIEYEDPTEEPGWTVDGPDEDHAPLPRRPRRRLVTPASLAAAAVVLAAGGFIAGVQVQKHQGGGGGGGRGNPLAALAARGGGGVPGGGAGSAAGARGAGSASRATGGAGRQATSSGTGGAAAGGGAGGAAAGGGANAGMTVGQVANVKGSTLYVTGADGTTVRVRVGSQAKVQRLASSTAKDVHPGDTVMVQGSTHQNGSVTASSVQAVADGLSLSFGGAPGGFGPAAGGGASNASGASASSGSKSSGGNRVDQLFGGN